MFCPNCGTPLEPDAKFCPNCGTPAPQDSPVNEAPAASEVVEAPVIPEAPVAEAPKAPEAPAEPVNAAPAAEAKPEPEAPKAAESQPTETPKAPESQSAAEPKTVTFTTNEDTLFLILRVVCGVLGAIFAFFTLKGAFIGIRYILGSLLAIPDVLRGYYYTGIFGYLFSFVLDLVFVLLDILVPLLAAASLILAAAKWEKKHADLIFVGLAAAAVLRLVRMILVLPLNLLLGLLVYHTTLTPSAYFFTTSLLHILGYMFTAAVVFLLMYLVGAAPVMNKSVDEIKANVRSSLSDITGKVHKDANKVAEKAAALENPVPAPTAAPAAAVSYSRMKKTNRSLLMYILLNIVTCGIYGYIFIYGLANDANEVCDGDGQKTGGLLAYILLNFITCNIYYYIWWYKLCNRVSANGPRYGVTIQENGTTFLLWSLVGLLLCGIGPLIALYQFLRNMNTLCAAYNHHNGFTA